VRWQEKSIADIAKVVEALRVEAAAALALTAAAVVFLSIRGRLWH
jgi:hypothetical protein